MASSQTSERNNVEIIVEIRMERDKAILAFDGANEIWIPRSLIRSMEEITGHPGNFAIHLPEWFAEKEGII